MTTAELKKNLIQKIDKVEDPDTLELLDTFLENLNAEVPQLEEWQLLEIEQSEQEYKEGNVISKEESDKKIVEWLKKLP